jgi:1-deoxy-D-xylulose-5-phosphate reductoisomerase
VFGVKKIVVLGASGSIGRQTLAVCAHLNSQGPARQTEIHALTALNDWRYLAEAARRFRPSLVALADPRHLPELQAALADLPVRVIAGREAVEEAAAQPDVDLVVAAISGLAGLPPLLAALHAGVDQVALANKEPLVAAGELVTKLARERGTRLLPLDSEHSALMQCLVGERREAVASLILTASGGPFRGWSREQLAQVTPAQALNHPRWRMGQKISVDSATMVNKGLEIIEAHWLFGLPYHQIEVLIHPESIVHSLVAFCDGAVKALLSAPDMRLPIQYAISGEARCESEVAPLDLTTSGPLSFYPPDNRLFPAMATFRAAGEMGGTAAAYLNGANEFLVKSFLQGEIRFTAISDILGGLLLGYNNGEISGFADIFAADSQGRRDAALAMVSGN